MNPLSAGRGARAAGIALISLAWIAVLFLALEAGLRIRWERLARANPLIKAIDREATDVMWAGHEDLWMELGVSYRKNTGVTLRRGERELAVRINSIGLRSNEVEVPKPAGIYRILCVGGSTTTEGETNATTYPALLERALNERRGAERFEVVNAGVCGLNSWTTLPKIEFLTSLEPDLVIHYNGVNDYLWVLLPVWQEKAPRWHRVMGTLELVKTLFPGLLLMGDEEYETLLSRYTLDNRRLMVDRFREKGIPVAICSFDVPDIRNATPEELFYLDFDLREVWGFDYIPFETYRRRIDTRNAEVRDLCREKGCIYFPVAERLSLGMEAYLDICHLKQEGIRRKAEVITGLVEEHLAATGHPLAR